LIAAALQASPPMSAEANLHPSPRGGVAASPPNWRQAPTMDDMHRVYPAGLKGRLAAALLCNLRDDGHVGHCDIMARHPDDLRVGQAAWKLATQFQAPPEYVAAARGNGRLWLELTLTPLGDDQANFADGLCPAPFCTAVPPAPPPPPIPRPLPTPTF
jgi:hypothetical protein